MTDPAKKILTFDQALAYREELRRTGKKLVVTNGCFDLMHRGHAQYLYESAMLGDALLILVNSDASVRELKGPERPIVDEYNRAYMLASLECISAVLIFPGERCTKELSALKADVYVKGGDYTIDTINAEEKAALLGAGTKICFKPFIPGFSTTRIIEKIIRGKGGNSDCK